jgi:uncharacterized protein
MTSTDLRPPPVVQGVPYHRVLAGEKRRIGRGVLALVLLVVGMLGAAVLVQLLGARLDAALGTNSVANGGTEFTPIFHAANLLPIALVIPISMLIQRRLYGVPGASLHSVVSRFRMDVFGRALLVVVPTWAVPLAVLNHLMPAGVTTYDPTDLLILFVISVLLCPLQSAGEEYGLRGLAFRVAASWGRGPRVALVLGVAVSALVFALPHLSTDPWINLHYVVLAVCLALITWRTGGLEWAIALHAVNNTFTYLIQFILHTDLVNVADRSAGTGSAALLVLCAAEIGLTAFVWLRSRRTGPPVTPGTISQAR